MPTRVPLDTPDIGAGFDPESFRMPVGDHLEDLRRHLILALVGVAVAFAFCLVIAKRILVPFVAGPLIAALESAEVNPQVFFTGVADPFFVYLRVSMVGAFVLSGPWVIYQAWRFVATGLYQKERRLATKALPASIGLFLAGIAFVWFVILPLTLRFLLVWAMTIPLPSGFGDALPVPQEQVEQRFFPLAAGNPDPPQVGQFWYDTSAGQVKLYVPDEEGALRVRVLNFGSDNLATPIITLPDYVSLVLMLLIVFGVSFQMPLVVSGLIKAGIFSPTDLRAQRRMVYFVMVILACVVTPGDVIAATLGLIGPLIVLYELGIWLGERGQRQAAA